MRYTVAILDIDDTIIDSNDAHAHAWVRALREHGRPAAFSEVRVCIGMGGDKLLQHIAGIDRESDEGRRISDTRRSIFSTDYLPSLRPTHGARHLIERLRREDVDIAIATSAEAHEVHSLLKAAGVEDLIDWVASADDAERSKPDPDIVLAALRKSGTPKDRAIMLGDTPYDLQAAASAGIAAVAFRTGGWADNAFAGAAAIFNDPEDLVAHYETSPFARDGPAA